VAGKGAVVRGRSVLREKGEEGKREERRKKGPRGGLSFD
jgi:hypothetical protein